ncbi:Pleckstrin domain [Trinorchestia longiramus]|nr:Pleckstrin domain [Trinorchestia longiramus]
MKINDKNLAAFSVSPTTIHRDGYLLKQGENNRTFLKRWFVLKGNLLFYFEKKGDKEPIGVIIVEGCTIELAEHEEQICCFRIVFPAREYVLAADNQENLEKWMKSLARSSYSYLKLMVAELEVQLKELDGALASSNEHLKESNNTTNTPTTSTSTNTTNNTTTTTSANNTTTSPTTNNTTTGLARHRLNPFNTAEENEAIVIAMLPLEDELLGSLPEGEEAKARVDLIGTSATSNQPSESQKSPIPALPVPPKRHKKSSRRIPSASQSSKKSSSNSDLSSTSDGKSSSLCHCRNLGTTSCACCREYFLFQQLHLDYGAAILRDREMHRLLSSNSNL